MQRNRIFTAGLALILLFSAVSVSAQGWKGRGRLQGDVVGEDGNPVEDARVTLRSAAIPDEGPETFHSNKKGHWSYLGLSGGAWLVTIEKEGYIPSDGQVPITEFGTNPRIKVTLRLIPEEMLREAAQTEILAKVEKGNELLGQGKHSEARAAYEEALATMEPEQQPPVLLGVAQSYFQEGSVDEAIQTLDRILAIAPADTDALALKAQLFYQAGDVDGAIESLEAASAASPEDAKLLQLLVDLLVRSDREDEAQEYIARMPEGVTLSADTVLNMGIDLYNENDADGALEFFNQAVKENPKLSDAYYYRGLTHLSKGMHAEAIADFHKLLEIDPEHPSAEEAKQFLAYLESQQ